MELRPINTNKEKPKDWKTRIDDRSPIFFILFGVAIIIVSIVVISKTTWGILLLLPGAVYFLRGINKLIPK